MGTMQIQAAGYGLSSDLHKPSIRSAFDCLLLPLQLRVLEEANTNNLAAFRDEIWETYPQDVLEGTPIKAIALGVYGVSFREEAVVAAVPPGRYNLAGVRNGGGADSRAVAHLVAQV